MKYVIDTTAGYTITLPDKINVPHLRFTDSRELKPIRWPSNIVWHEPNKKPDVETYDEYAFTCVDGLPYKGKRTGIAYRVDGDDIMKPRMWYSYADRRWYCQRHLIRGMGTTQRGAWDAMWNKIRSE